MSTTYEELAESLKNCVALLELDEEAWIPGTDLYTARTTATERLRDQERRTA